MVKSYQSQNEFFDLKLEFYGVYKIFTSVDEIMFLSLFENDTIVVWTTVEVDKVIYSHFVEFCL